VRPIPGTSEPGPTPDERVAALIDRVRQQRAHTRQIRQQMAERRAHGLQQRHAAKTKWKEQSRSSASASTEGASSNS